MSKENCRQLAEGLRLLADNSVSISDEHLNATEVGNHLSVWDWEGKGVVVPDGVAARLKELGWYEKGPEGWGHNLDG